MLVPHTVPYEQQGLSSFACFSPMQCHRGVTLHVKEGDLVLEGA